MTETADIYSLFTTSYIYKYFIRYLCRCPWRYRSHGGLLILRMWVAVQVTASFFFLSFFFSLLLLQCDFNSNLMPYSGSPTFF